ncbi:MAG: LmeA family phospholipid-binding protein [Armatimonadetes bacterium]|nr:LmeA family phospholipid-binding protein [Armatimonadota bacterium]
MDWKDALIAFFGLVIVSGAMESRLEGVATHRLRQFIHGGQLQVDVAPRGFFGALVGQAYAIKITGSGNKISDIPLVIAPGHALSGTARHLDINLNNFDLAGIPVKKLKASVPLVHLDLNQALLDGHIRLMSAKTGQAELVIGRTGLQAILKREVAALKEVHIEVAPNYLQITGNTSLWLITEPFQARFNLNVDPAGGLAVENLQLTVGGQKAGPLLIQKMEAMMIPALNLQSVFGLGKLFQPEAITLEHQKVKVSGSVRLPVQKGGRS